jgi:outer membrane cobalamin receptor
LYAELALLLQKIGDNMSKNTLFLWLVCIFLAQMVQAQTDNVEKDTAGLQSLHELVVTSNRTSTVRLEALDAIDVVDNTRWSRFQPRTTPEILFQMPGVFVQKTNHGGGSPFIRGLTGNQTLLLLDGIRLNNATYRYGPNQYLNTVDAFSLKSIEILRGSGSVQYGSDALGGTVQLFTKNVAFTEKSTWTGDFLGRLWSQGMEESAHGSMGFSGKNVAVHGGVSVRHFGDLVGGDTTGRQSPTGYAEYAFDVKSKIRLGKYNTITLAHNEVIQRQVPVFHKILLENYKINEFEPQKRMLSYVRMDGKTNARGIENWYIIASRQHTKEGRISQKNGATTRREEQDDVVTYAVTSNITSVISKRLSSNSGLELYADHVGSTRQDYNISDGTVVEKRGLYPDGARMLSVAAFSLQELTLDRWKITTGTRFNAYQIDVQDAVLGAIQLTPAAWVWNAGVQRTVYEHTNVFLSYNSGFRTPNIDDLGTLGIVDFRYEVPNYALQPERSHNFQLGVKSHNNRVRTEMYLYRNILNNLIARVKTLDTIQGYPVYQKENIERAYIQGVENQFSISLRHDFLVDGHLAYCFGQNLTKQEPVRRIPPLNARVAIRFQPKRWFVALEWLAASAQTRLAQGDRDDNRIPIGGTPAWSVFNVYGGYTRGALRVNLNVVNVLNADYRLHGSGVNGAGRSVVLSIGYRFFHA